MTRRPTLLEVGIACAVIGLAFLVKPVRQALLPAPIATIDSPEANSTVHDCFIAAGRLLPSTIWRPLWLIGTDDRGEWRPEKKIDPSLGGWQGQVCPGKAATRLALVLADDELDKQLTQWQLSPLAEEMPDWLKARYPGRGRRHYREGVAPLPDGARMVAFVQVHPHREAENHRASVAAWGWGVAGAR